MCNGRFVQSGTSIDVHGVDHVVCSSAPISGRRMRRFELPRRSEEEAAIGREGQTAKERGECLIGINTRILESKS